MTLFFAALIGVSAVAVVVLTVMVARAVFGRRRRGSSDALAILDDEDGRIEGPEDGDELAFKMSTVAIEVCGVIREFVDGGIILSGSSRPRYKAFG